MTVKRNVFSPVCHILVHPDSPHPTPLFRLPTKKTTAPTIPHSQGAGAGTRPRAPLGAAPPSSTHSFSLCCTHGENTDHRGTCMRWGGGGLYSVYPFRRKKCHVRLELPLLSTTANLWPLPRPPPTLRHRPSYRISHRSCAIC